jgi:Ribonuclease G/E
MPRIERDREIARRRHRKVKIQKLITKYMKTTVQADKVVIANKVRRLSPFYNLEERVAVIKESQAKK